MENGMNEENEQKRRFFSPSCKLRNVDGSLISGGNGIWGSFKSLRLYLWTRPRPLCYTLHSRSSCFCFSVHTRHCYTQALCDVVSFSWVTFSTSPSTIISPLKSMMLSGLSSDIISKKPFLNPKTGICLCFVPVWNSCLFVSWWLITSSSVGSYLYVCSQGFQPFLVPNEHPENRLLLWSNLNPQTFSLCFLPKPTHHWDGLQSPVSSFF